MHDIYLTVQGNLASEVTYRVTNSGVALAYFRLASSATAVDGAGQWRQTGKAHFDVTCWRRTAENARDCLAKGLPVVVHGRFRQRQVTREAVGGAGGSYEQTVNDIEALGLGLDLTRCRARYERSPVGPQVGESAGAGPTPAAAVAEAA